MGGIILSPAYTNLIHKKLILKLYLLYFSSAIYCDCPVRFAVIIIIGPAILAVWDHPFCQSRIDCSDHLNRTKGE